NSPIPVEIRDIPPARAREKQHQPGNSDGRGKRQPPPPRSGSAPDLELSRRASGNRVFNLWFVRCVCECIELRPDLMKYLLIELRWNEDWGLREAPQRALKFRFFFVHSVHCLSIRRAKRFNRNTPSTEGPFGAQP